MANAAIKKAIEALGSRSALAALLGCGASFVSQLESGDKQIPVKKVGQLSDATGIPHHEFRPDIFPVTERA